MIAHLVLFTPRPTLSRDEGLQFHHALTTALETIPSIVSYRVGRRVRTGAAYDVTAIDFEFFALIEFNDRQGLADYLSHPAHAELGRVFHETSERALALDYDAVGDHIGEALERWRGSVGA
jgi:hypothetical protein